MNTLYRRNFLKISDFNASEIITIINLSKILKQKKKNKIESHNLKNKNIVLIFEKESTRTRCAFEVAAFDQGANVTYLGPGTTHLGYKESIKDTAKVLGRMYDGIQYRGHDHKNIEILAKYSNVPVWNGLTEKFHPTQLLADLLTIHEILPKKLFSEISCAYIGDIQNNIGNTLLETAVLMGINLRLISPKCLWPKSSIILKYKKKSKKNFGNIIFTENIKEGIEYVDFIYTDVWISMGENENSWEKKIQLLKKYQINSKILALTKNKKTKILHCLPSFHDKNTILGKKIIEKYNLKNGIEITNEIFKDQSKTIFEQSENRLHTIKALMIATLVKNFSKI